MLIRSKFERPNAPIEFPGKTYFFRPVAGASGPHICEVTDPAHAARLLEITEGYEPYEAPQLLRAPPQPPLNPPPQMTVEGTEPPATGNELDQAIETGLRDRAQALRSLPVAELRTQLAQIQDARLLSMLLQFEREATAPPPRTSVVTIVQARLNAVTTSDAQ